MTDEIKQRIEQIKRGEVPQGYKKTVVGIVPQQWEETQLSNVFLFKNGLNKEKSAFGKGIPIVNYVDVWKNRGINSNQILGKVTLSQKEIENYNVKKGDVFFTRTSETKDEIGLSCVMLDEPVNTVFSGFVLRARPITDKIYIPYNKYCYSSDLMRYEVIKKSSITTRALTSGTSLGQVKLNLPSIDEQQRIAEILSKWDKAIELQQKLIEKLELQKKALMQNLLTPKDDWKKVKLKDVIKVLNGYAFKSNTYVKNGLYKVITISNVKDNDFIIDDKTATVELLPNDIREFQKLEKDDILISLTGNVGRICKVTEDFCVLNQRVGKISVIDENDKDFIFYYLQTYRFVEYMKMFAQGAAQDNLSVKDIYRYEILIPPTMEDEKSIVKNLHCIDEYTELQTQKLDKLKQQQKAMQQLLLTGIVRV